jgi:hypothetical protein
MVGGMWGGAAVGAGVGAGIAYAESWDVNRGAGIGADVGSIVGAFGPGIVKAGSVAAQALRTLSARGATEGASLGALEVGGINAGKVGLFQRLTLRWQHRALISRLKRGDVAIADIAGTSTKEGAFGLMGELTAATNREVALVRTVECRVLRLGSETRISTSGVSGVIAHTHPSGRLGISPIDYRTYFLGGKHQSTIIVGPTGAWRRFTSYEGIPGGNI